MTIVLAIPAFLELTGSAEENIKVASMGWFCLLGFPVLVLPLLFSVPDTKSSGEPRIEWRHALRVIFKNSSMLRLLIADFSRGLGMSVSGALYIFIAATYFALPKHASIALLFYFLASFIAMPFWMKAAYKYGKDRALKFAVAYVVIINLALIPFAEAGNIAVLWIFTISFGLAFGAPPMLLRSMMADLTDEDELQSGQKRPGLFFALLTTTDKVGAALGVGISFSILELAFGFQPGGSNSADALEGLLLTYTIGFAAPTLIAYLALRSYPLTKEKHDAIVNELRARQA
jgi:Na+/melibiose symporter-like transporter